MQIQELLEKTNLNFSVRKEGIQTISGIPIEDKCALVRTDTNKHLSVMGDGYEPYQNSELAELLFKINKSTGMDVHTGGSFNGGSKIFFQLKSDTINLGGDKIEGYVSGINSFDGSTSLSFGNSTLTISCMNTFFKCYKNLDSKVKHTASMRPRIDEILKGIDILLKDEQTDFQTIKRMSEIALTPEIEQLIIRTMFNLNLHDKFEDLSTRKKNQIVSFKSDWAKEIAQKGENLWGGMSAATRYSTHTQFNTQEKSQLNKMFGKAGEVDRAVWHKLTEKIKAY
jgi:hypothetical protein